jgi:hypothetical protein
MRQMTEVEGKLFMSYLKVDSRKEIITELQSGTMAFEVFFFI